MYQNLRNIKKAGFTVIELLVVIIVIGILATLVIVAYNSVQSGARDKSVMSDLDELDGLETRCGLNKTACGITTTATKAWYSGSGVDSYLKFTPSPGDVIDVATNSTDYCIRGYNPSSAKYKTLATAAIKESTAGVCAILPASLAAQADSITPNGGVVTTLAGMSGTLGYVNATGNAAEFKGPFGAAVDSVGNVYIGDSSNNAIRKITPAGVVTTFAGSASGVSGSANGTGTAASFNSPFGVAVDSSGNVYVADTLNYLIRKITPAGVVTTIGGALSYVVYGIAVDGAGNIYMAEPNNNIIQKVTPAGVVSTYAGNGTAGNVDGAAASAEFNFPTGVALDSTGNIFVTDTSNHTIRKITPTGTVSTFAGSGTSGSSNGIGTAASFNYPYGVAVDLVGNLYVSDYNNNLIRMITSGRLVTTMAGRGSPGSANGIGTAASFNYPYGIAVDSSGVVYVVDNGNELIRKIK